MPTLAASQVAKLLHEFGQRISLRGGNPYRARAYTRAAENLLVLAEPLEDIIAQNRLREIPGVGQAIADIVTEIHRTGRHPALDAMRQEIPASILDLLTVPGLKPDKALKLHKELGISSLDDLEQAAKQERLKDVKGLGSALQSKILQGIEIKRGSEGKRHIHRAATLLELAQAQLVRSKPGVSRIIPAGDFRRGCELIGDLSLVAQCRTPTALSVNRNNRSLPCI
jgi:DNA polymerase (family X)